MSSFFSTEGMSSFSCRPQVEFAVWCVALKLCFNAVAMFWWSYWLLHGSVVIKVLRLVYETSLEAALDVWVEEVIVSAPKSLIALGFHFVSGILELSSHILKIDGVTTLNKHLISLGAIWSAHMFPGQLHNLYRVRNWHLSLSPGMGKNFWIRLRSFRLTQSFLIKVGVINKFSFPACRKWKFECAIFRPLKVLTRNHKVIS